MEPKQVTTTSGQCGLGSNGDEEVLPVFQSSGIGASLSDSLVSYPGHTWACHPTPSAEMQSVYYTALTVWTLKKSEKETKGFCSYEYFHIEFIVINVYRYIYIYICIYIYIYIYIGESLDKFPDFSYGHFY